MSSPEEHDQYLRIVQAWQQLGELKSSMQKVSMQVARAYQIDALCDELSTELKQLMDEYMG